MTKRKKSNKATEDVTLDLTSSRGVSHWMQITGDYLVILANEVPGLSALKKMSPGNMRNLSGNLLCSVFWALREWDKVLDWLQFNAPQDLKDHLKGKYQALPIENLQQVASLVAEIEPGEKYAANHAEPWPETPAKLIHTRRALQKFGGALLETATALEKQARGQETEGIPTEATKAVALTDLRENVFRKCGDTGYLVKLQGNGPEIIGRKAGQLRGLDYIHVLLQNEAKHHKLPHRVPGTMSPRGVLLAVSGGQLNHNDGGQPDVLIDHRTWNEAQEKRKTLLAIIDDPIADPADIVDAKEQLEPLEKAIKRDTRPDSKKNPRSKTFVDKKADAIRKAIKRATKEIAKQDEDLARHLYNHISHKSGHRYAPDSHLDWDLG